MCHRSHMAAKKSDAEKGPLGAWAYGTRDLLDASPEDAAAAAGISYATLRKIEGGSTRAPARRTVYALWQHYRRIGLAKGMPVEDPPAEWRQTVPLPAPTTDLAGAITALTAELRAWREDDRRRLDTLWDATVWLLRAIRPPEGAPTSAERPPPLEVLERGGR